MKTYLLQIETRDGEYRTEGPFLTFKEAQNEIAKYFSHWPPEDLLNYRKYDSNFNEGRVYSGGTSGKNFSAFY